MPKSVEARRYREFFASHLELGTKRGTLKISRFSGNTVTSTVSNELLSTSLTSKDKIPPAQSFKFTFPTPSTRTSKPFRFASQEVAEVDLAKDLTKDRPHWSRKCQSSYPQELQNWLERMPSPDNLENRVRNEIKAHSQNQIERLESKHSKRAL